MHSILVPTDFSKNTQTALSYAIDLANQFACKLILFNTYKLSHRAGMYIGVERMMREESREQMAQLLREVRPKIKGEASVEGKVAKGEAVSTIIRAAKKLEINLIVMGTQGASGLKEVFIGSTTSGVINGSKIPVLAVPSEFKYRPIKTIALSLDGESISSELSLESLRMVIYRYSADVRIFHIATTGQPVGIELKGKLPKILSRIDHTVQVIETSSDKVNQSIKKFVEEKNADLLCMIKRDRGFWGNLFHSSVTTREAFSSSIPLLILFD
jgi:nucleotide-binding universal stress UspA family protein